MRLGKDTESPQEFRCLLSNATVRFDHKWNKDRLDIVRVFSVDVALSLFARRCSTQCPLTVIDINAREKILSNDFTGVDSQPETILPSQYA